MIKLFLKSPSNGGWTLIEMAVVAAVAGILAALSMPSMIGMKARQDLKSDLITIKGLITEAQRSAIRKGQSCTVTIASTSITASPVGCISSNYEGTSTISGDSPLIFNYKGTIGAEKSLTLSSTRTSEQKCIAISILGTTRSGYIEGGNCVNSF